MSARKRNPWRERLRTVWFMFVVTLLFGAAVSAAHVFTQNRVQANATLFQKRAVRAAAGLPVLDDPALLAWYGGAVTNEAPACYGVRLDDGATARVFIRNGSGLWGTIIAAIGIAADGATLTGLAFLEQNETPGLGARIVEPWFTGQVRGRRGPLRLLPEGTRDAAPTAIDAITGATITSAAVRDMLNAALAAGVAASDDGKEGDAHDGGK